MLMPSWFVFANQFIFLIKFLWITLICHIGKYWQWQNGFKGKSEVADDKQTKRQTDRQIDTQTHTDIQWQIQIDKVIVT